MYEVIIIGAGAAGLTSAMYSARRKLKTLVVSVDIGGQTLLTGRIENYPGIWDLSGPDLMKRFEDQTKKYDVDLVAGKVVSLEKSENSFNVKLSNNEAYKTKTVILAYGKVPRSLGIPGEEKFIGRGIGLCVTADGEKFKDRTVAIIGGGNSAIEASFTLSKIAKKVYLVHRKKEFRAEEINVEKLKKCENVEFVLEYVPKEFKGDSNLKSVLLKKGDNEEEKEILVDGCFIEIGYEINVDFVRDIVKINEKKEVIINDRCETSCKGIFAAGDITTVPYKQAVIASGEGAKAAMSAYNFIKGAKVFADWNH